MLYFELIISCIAILIILGGRYIKRYVDKYKREAAEWQKKHDRMLSLKKSSEVRLGFIGENLAPFTDSWPYDPGNFIFIGRAVDGIQINNDEIIFVEIKTGKARLSKSQKRIKELVREGKVYFETYRIDENGCTLKRAENLK